MSDQAELIDFFAAFQALGAEDLAAIDECSRAFEAQRGAFLCRAGDRSREFFYLRSGIARAWYQRNDREITGWLTFAGDLAGCFSSMATGEAASEWIEIIEDAQVIAFDYPRLQQAGETRPALLKLSLRILEWSYLRLEDRLAALQCTSAEERLRHLLEREARVLERVPHYQVASYLGITPETLSRVKSKLFRSD